MNNLKFLRNYFLFFLATKRTYINVILGMAVLIASILWIVNTNTKDFDLWNIERWWNAWGDPFIGLSTFLVAIVIWLTNIAIDWENRLDKKLTVTYKYGDKEVVKCKKAYLAHEGDIRNWGQTLGRLAVGNSSDDRDYSFKYNSSKFERKDSVVKKGMYFFKHFDAIFFLSELPNPQDIKSGYDMRKGCFIWKEGNHLANFVEYKNPSSTIHKIASKE